MKIWQRAGGIPESPQCGARPDHTHHTATAMMRTAIKNIGSTYQGHSGGSGASRGFIDQVSVVSGDGGGPEASGYSLSARLRFIGSVCTRFAWMRKAASAPM
jgi:hypothetical protein